MSKAEFDAAIDYLLIRFSGSLTSGRRTDTRALVVGGFAGDPHTWGLGADVLWDVPPALPLVEAYAHQLNLKVIRETNKPHDHFQPLDFPAGPVTSYGGVTRE